MKNIIEISKLSKSFPSPDGEETVHVFNEVDLAVETGSSVAIVGPSGSGKSTLLNVIGLLDKPTKGSIEVNQRSLGSLSDKEVAEYRNQTVGFVFQSHHLLPSCSVLENVMVPALAGFGKEDITVELAENTLSVRSDKKDESDEYTFHRGISYRKFDRKFTLADDIVVNSASLENGMLTIELERIVPEEKKPRIIEVN